MASNTPSASDLAKLAAAEKPAAAETAAPKPAAKKVVAEAVEAFTPAAPIGEDRWQLKEHRNPGHWVNVRVGTTIAQLLVPAFWANVARHLTRYATIEAHWDDASQFAELYVLDAGRNWASVAVLRHVALVRPELRHHEEQYEIAFSGPVDRFRVLRLSDRVVIQAGFATEAAAQVFLSEHKRKLAA